MTKLQFSLLSLLVVTSAMLPGRANALPILDGSGFSTVPNGSVKYDSTAPSSNFNSPNPTTNGAAYNVYLHSDLTYGYVLLETTGAGVSAGPFANLYLGTGLKYNAGAYLGFEVTVSQAFIPGGVGPVSYAALPDATRPLYAVLTINGHDAIEFAVPFAYFQTDPQGLGFPTTSTANPNVELRDSQSFGYTYVGGATFGPDRFGILTPTAPEATPTPAPEIDAGSTQLPLAFALGCLLIASDGRRRQRA